MPRHGATLTFLTIGAAFHKLVDHTTAAVLPRSRRPAKGHHWSPIWPTGPGHPPWPRAWLPVCSVPHRRYHPGMEGSAAPNVTPAQVLDGLRAAYAYCPA